MTTGDFLLLLVRWLHLLAAVAWIGGGIIYLLVLRPISRDKDSALQHAMSSARFQVLVDVCIWMLVVTGAILLLNRLASPALGPIYLGTLVTKIVMAFVLFILVLMQRRRLNRRSSDQNGRAGRSRFGTWITGGAASVILGIIVFLLADLLQYVYERGL